MIFNYAYRLLINKCLCALQTLVTIFSNGMYKEETKNGQRPNNIPLPSDEMCEKGIKEIRKKTPGVKMFS